MIEQLNAIKTGALTELAEVQNMPRLETWRVRYLGRKSDLTQILRSLAEMPVEDRRTVGARAGAVKSELETALRQKEQELQATRSIQGSSATTFDISLPGRRPLAGHLHPLTQTVNEICEIFVAMGFGIAEGPEVESDYYNFEALNIPEEHPARDTMSSSWVDAVDDKGRRSMLLRTHTTCVTARILEANKPPIRMVEPGKVYRYEASDATHVPMFHQIDGIAVDRNITMADLKGTLYEFARRFFGADRGVRFRCDFFPFVEPGVEMAIECVVCRGSGCRLCHNSGWIEILGAGMTHPSVMERAGIDSQAYTSFAFGIGVDRLPMLRYGIEDVRSFYNNDLRFLRQF